MKKLLVAISLLLVAATIMAIPAFGANTPAGPKDLKWYVGQDVHYLGDPIATAPAQDGTINKDEYTYTYRLTDPTFMADPTFYKIPTDPAADTSAEYIDFYFAYDEDYVYIAMYEKFFFVDEDTLVHNTNPQIKLSINADDPTKAYNSFAVANGAPDGKNKQSDFGKSGSNREYYITGGDPSYTIKTGTTATAITEKDAPKYAGPSVTTGWVSRSGDTKTGIYSTMELKISKDNLLGLSNDYLGTNYANFPNIFFFNYQSRQFGDIARELPNTYVVWNAKELTNAQRLQLGTKAEYVPAIYVLGNEGDETAVTTTATETTPAETTTVTAQATTVTTAVPTTVTTEVPTTVTTAVPTTTATDAPATSAATTAATTEPAKGGCGSSVTAMGIALVAALGTCAVVATKKKED